jgi:hypothetical protein
VGTDLKRWRGLCFTLKNKKTNLLVGVEGVKLLSAGDADPGTHFKEEKKRSRPYLVKSYRIGEENA